MANLNMDRNDDYPQHNMPLEPPAFPEPILDSCVRINSTVRDRNGTTQFYQNAVLVKTRSTAPFNRAGRFNINNESDHDDSSSSSSSSSSSNSSSDSSMEENEDTPEQSQEKDSAYLIFENVHNAIYGRVYRGKVLLKCPIDNVWQMTTDECAIKAMTWEGIRRGRELNQAENPQDEIAAMQHLMQHLDGARGRHLSAHDAMRETNVIMPLDFLFDDRNLYTITPYCTGGEMFAVLMERQSFSEPESRYLLRSILDGLESFQRVGLCHRDISLENILVDHERTFIIDMGMCLRIPFDDDGGDADMQRNVDYRERSAHRCLIQRPQRAGKLSYMSPEVYSERPFDGHAVDMWAVGVCLYMMLTGTGPWTRAATHDDKFRLMSTGCLVELFTNYWGITLSGDAMDLLQRMLFKDPQDRLSLQQVRDHPWMDGPMINPM